MNFLSNIIELPSFNETVEFPNLFSGDIHISRIAISIFGFDIYWYGIFIAIGVILGFAYAMKRAKKVGLIADRVFDVAFICAIIGFIGARIYYCVFYNLTSTSKFKYDIITTFTGVRDGGLAIYGGIIFAVIGGFIFSKLLKVKILPLLDLAGLGFFIGQGIGRWGNFFNQEAFGAPTADNLPWGMTGSGIVNSSEYVSAMNDLGLKGDALVHPCFLYEFLWCLIGFVALHFYSKKLKTYDGEIFLLYASWYGLGRAWIEGLRTDSLYAGTIKISQLIAIFAFVFGLFLFIFFKIKVKNNKDYKMYVDTDESKEMIAEFEKNIKLDKEKEEAYKALKAAKKAERELEKEQNEPKAPSILGDSEDTADEKPDDSKEE